MSVESELPSVAVVLPAAGRGVRMGGTRKQYRLLGDRPLLARTLEAFDRHEAVAQVIVVVPPDEVTHVGELLSDQDFDPAPQLVAGGDCRSESVQNGVAVVDDSVEIVLVHDAVRPFVSARQIDAVIRAASAYGAASLALPVVDTLRRGEESSFGDLVERAGIYRVQTPQAFRRTLLVRAHAAARALPVTATDDATLVMALGHAVRIVPGSAFNFKVTTEDDWELACTIWDTWSRNREGGGPWCA